MTNIELPADLFAGAEVVPLEEAAYQDFLQRVDRLFYQQALASADHKVKMGADAIRLGLVHEGKIYNVATCVLYRYKKIFQSLEVNYGPLVSLEDLQDPWVQALAKAQGLEDLLAQLAQNTPTSVPQADQNSKALTISTSEDSSTTDPALQASQTFLPGDLLQAILLPVWLKKLQEYLKKEMHRVIHLTVVPLIHRTYYAGTEAKGSNPALTQVEGALQDAGFSRLNEARDVGFSPEALASLPLTQMSLYYAKRIEGKTFEENWKTLKYKMRSDFKRGKKYHLKIRFLTADDLELYEKMQAHTVERTGASESTIVPLTTAFFEAYGPDCLVPLVYLNVDESLAGIRADIEAMQAKIDAWKAKGEPQNRRRAMMEEAEEITRAQARLEEVESLRTEADSDANIPLATGHFMRSKTDFIYLQSAAYRSYLHFQPLAILHETMLRIAVESGCTFYNLFGVLSLDPDSPDRGVLDFKESFQGDVEELIGSYGKALSFGFLQ